MSAARHIHPNQLRMFMPAGELKAMQPNPHDLHTDPTNPINNYEYESTDSLWSRKKWQASQKSGAWGEGGSLIDSIAKEGVERPVHVFHGTVDHPIQGMVQGPVIANGHHRIAGANAVSPDTLVPVVHHPGGKGRAWSDAVWAADPDQMAESDVEPRAGSSTRARVHKILEGMRRDFPE